MVNWAPKLLVAAAALPSLQKGFTDSHIKAVRSNVLKIANASWELGTTAEALTELLWPSLSVFNTSAFPPPTHLDKKSTPTDVFRIVNKTLADKPADSLPLISNQGSAADPASLGVAVLVANWTRWDKKNQEYADAVAGQLDYLLHVAPRSEDGAISHRADEVQLWADFVYMVPPFIAYYGALQGNRTLLQTAYDQCKIYRDALRDDSGLWRHTVLGSFEDDTHWATGNGWAAAGMLRVLSTFNHSARGHQFASHQANLTKWIQEILIASWSHQATNGTLLNVIDDPDSFGDTSATALLASVTYRMAVFTHDTTMLPAANLALKLVQASVNKNGWLQNTVNPLTFHDPNPKNVHSPEGQAFVLLLHSAWRAFSDFISKKDT